jgi:predicted amidohydrolase YtcJ
MWLACPSCGKLTQSHYDWSKDVRNTEYKLNKGQRFFRDGTTEEAIAYMHKQIEIFKANGEILDEETIQGLLKDAREGKNHWKPGWPKLDIF